MPDNYLEAAQAAQAIRTAHAIQQAYQNEAKVERSDEAAQLQEAMHVSEVLRTLPAAIAALFFPHGPVAPEFPSQYWGKPIAVVFDGDHVVYVAQGVLIKRPQLLRYYADGAIRIHGLDVREAHIFIHYLYTGKWEPLEPAKAPKIDQIKSALIEAVSLFDAGINHDLRNLGRLASIQFNGLAKKLDPIEVLEHFADYAYAGLHGEFMIAEYAFQHTNITDAGFKHAAELFFGREKYESKATMARIILGHLEDMVKDEPEADQDSESTQVAESDEEIEDSEMDEFEDVEEGFQFTEDDEGTDAMEEDEDEDEV
ncbi:hypothetical protein FHETE_2714 [Fusarium heterosporum]|uniref:BTB domain-containing protein n=1 Tax=Fusarium heterosporum TaxID=42747 RepID=A0A8H5TR62_FUSHE|nr:hypothetical protein FHETE_2714 [Fusarium heterosporum]